MKEIIIQHTVTAAEAQAQNIVLQVSSAMTKDNVLGIINESKSEVIYTPMQYSRISAAYSLGVLTVSLLTGAPAIAEGNKLFIKLYTDEGSSGETYDEMIAQFFGIADATTFIAASDSDITTELERQWAEAFGTTPSES